MDSEKLRLTQEQADVLGEDYAIPRATFVFREVPDFSEYDFDAPATTRVIPIPITDLDLKGDLPEVETNGLQSSVADSKKDEPYYSYLNTSPFKLLRDPSIIMRTQEEHDVPETPPSLYKTRRQAAWQVQFAADVRGSIERALTEKNLRRLLEHTMDMPESSDREYFIEEIRVKSGITLAIMEHEARVFIDGTLFDTIPKTFPDDLGTLAELFRG